jgi:outer membrane protein assembly factor BamB
MGSDTSKRSIGLRPMRSGKRFATGISSLALLAGMSGGGAAAATTLSAGPRAMPAKHVLAESEGARTVTGADSNWTVYHANLGGSGAAPAGLKLLSVRHAWTSPALDGNLYGEPLVWDDRVYMATENDTVYALSVSNGHVVWSRHLATPVPSGDLPCGNIGPTVGITSTPVIDTARGEIFVVADELVSGRPRHEFYGLSTADGAIIVKQHVDPPGADTAAILQRASLTLDGGEVVFGFGGNYGDCSSYHGWVESVPVSGGKAHFFEVDAHAGDSQGAIWMGGGAPVLNAKGDVWVAAGNGSVHSPGRYDDSDSVLELSPSLKLLQFFAPSDWYDDNANDRDLGSSVPAVLPNGLVVQAGKSQTVYLLRASRLGGIGGQVDEKTNICGNDVDGGVAFSGSTVYLPCENGVMAVATDAKTLKLRVLWQTPTGAGGPPILAGGLVWTISSGNLFALSPRTGKAVERFSINGAATDFPTPSFGDGHLLAISNDQVYGFVER